LPCQFRMCRGVRRPIAGEAILSRLERTGFCVPGRDGHRLPACAGERATRTGPYGCFKSAEDKIKYKAGEGVRERMRAARMEECCLTAVF
jgi:hypothetical protein